jgi:hypothetical protein
VDGLWVGIGDKGGDSDLSTHGDSGSLSLVWGQQVCHEF